MLKAQILNAVQKVKRAIQDLGIDSFVVQRTPLPHVAGRTTEYREIRTATKVIVSSYQAKEVDGDRIQARDLQGLILPPTDVTIVPEVGDAILVGALEYRIMNTERIMAGDEVALSIVQMRLR